MPALTMDTWLLIGVFTIYASISYVLLYQAARRDAAMRRTLDRLSEEMHAQTQIMQRAFRTQIQRNDAAIRQDILTQLLLSGYYSGRENRDALVNSLPPAFTNTLTRSEAISTDLQNLVNSAWRWRADGTMVSQLIDCAVAKLNGSDAGVALLRIKGELDQ